MTEELDEQIRENATQPRRASADGVEAEQHSLSKQIEADRCLESLRPTRHGLHPLHHLAILCRHTHLPPQARARMAARERWGSKLGIILAVAGSAVGLGNFLRFPVQAARNGGGAFMIPYFVALILLGLPLMWIEWTVGRFGGGFGHSTAPGMFHTPVEQEPLHQVLRRHRHPRPARHLHLLHLRGVLAAGLQLLRPGRLLQRLPDAGGHEGVPAPATRASARALGWAWPTSSSPSRSSTNIVIVYFGIQRGIERVCKYALPALLLLGVVLMVRVLTLGAPDPMQPDRSVIKGLAMLWTPDWSALLNAHVWLAAAGQVFFTLSVGIGVILTYASYLTPRDDIALSGPDGRLRQRGGRGRPRRQHRHPGRLRLLRRGGHGRDRQGRRLQPGLRHHAAGPRQAADGRSSSASSGSPCSSWPASPPPSRWRSRPSCSWRTSST